MWLTFRAIHELDAFVARFYPPRHPRRRVSFTWNVRLPGGTHLTCKELTMLSLSVRKKATVTMGVPVDADGNATTIDGAYTFANLNPELATLVPAADGQSFDLIAGTVANQMCVIEVSADVDRGDGVKTHTEQLAIGILPGEAVAFSATMGPESEPTP